MLAHFAACQINVHLPKSKQVKGKDLFGKKADTMPTMSPEITKSWYEQAKAFAPTLKKKRKE